MFKLESIELVGFKSFRKKTRVLLHDQVTAVVGPNGCGKSNLADAIGWVLGAQTVRGLRGQRMEDVIFNGTRNHGPSGVARVTLVLTRTGDTPPESDSKPQEERLEITRKLYRSEESVYLINGQRSRLKQIYQRLEEAGLGFASYALIAQGRLDHLLSAKSLDRRSVVEEAAGIIGYKNRRRRAQLKLDLAQQNLLRTNDIISEVERQLRSLKRQATKASRFRKLKEEFHYLQRSKLALQMSRLERREQTLSHQILELAHAHENIAEELHAHEEKHRRNLEERNEWESQLLTLGRRETEAQRELDRSENRIRHDREQLESLQIQLREIKEEETQTSDSIQRLQEEILRAENEKAHVEAEKEALDAAMRDQQSKLERCSQRLEGAERELQESRDTLIRLSMEAANCRNLKNQQQRALSSAEGQLLRLAGEVAQHTSKRQESSNRLQEAERALAQRREQITASQEQLRSHQAERDDQQKRLDDLKAEIRDHQTRLVALDQRLQSLQEVEIDRSHYQEGVRDVLQHLSRSPSIHTAGTLADFVEPQPKYEGIVEEFLDQELEFVLVNSIDEAVRAVSEMKSMQRGKCTFLSLTAANGFGAPSSRNGESKAAAEEGSHGTLGQILRMKPEVEQAFRRVLPQHAEATVVGSLEEAFQLAHRYPETTFLTLEGEALRPRGLLSATVGQSKKLGLLRVKREKRRIEKSIRELQKKLGELERKQAQVEKQRQVLCDRCETSQEVLYRLEKEIISLTHQQEQEEREEQKENSTLKVLGKEIKQFQQEKEQLLEDIEAADRRRAEIQSWQSDVQTHLEASRDSLQELKTRSTQTQQRYHEVMTERQVLQERLAGLTSSLDRIVSQNREAETRQRTLAIRHEGTRKRIDETQSEVQELKHGLEKGRQEASGLQAVLDRRRHEFEQWKSSCSESEARLSQLRDETTRLQEKRAQLKVEQTRVETQMQNVAQLCLEQLQIQPEQLNQGLDLENLDWEQISQDFEQLKTRLEAYGPINMTALKEYEGNEVRHRFISEQRSDIEQSIGDTSRAIQEINRRSREKFRNAFEAINRYFQEVFQTLFGGGECGIRLVEEEDLLESGIDIFASPPGKRLQNVMLLSGGEKALTVLAFLVALFRFRPSRFCVMDEVDAALDDANVARFTHLVAQMAPGTQFVLITHNKQTIQTAETIYGVTMQEPGISQMVSVQLQS